MATKTTQTYTGTRVTFHSTQPFPTILDKFYASIGPVSNTDGWQKIVAEINKTPDSKKKEKFVALTEKQVGEHGFMIFQEFDHGAWVPIFGAGEGRKCKRIILGNPLIAITMLKHDMTAGLAVPVEMLVLEREDGADVIYQLPSALIAPQFEGVERDENLVKAAEELDGKLERLVRDVVT